MSKLIQQTLAVALVAVLVTGAISLSMVTGLTSVGADNKDQELKNELSTFIESIQPEKTAVPQMPLPAGVRG